VRSACRLSPPAARDSTTPSITWLHREALLPWKTGRHGRHRARGNDTCKRTHWHAGPRQAARSSGSATTTADNPTSAGQMHVTAGRRWTVSRPLASGDVHPGVLVTCTRRLGNRLHRCRRGSGTSNFLDYEQYLPLLVQCAQQDLTCQVHPVSEKSVRFKKFFSRLNFLR